MKPELLPAKMPEEKRDEAEMNAMKMKAERQAELQEEKAKARRDPTPRIPKKHLKAEYRRGQKEAKLPETMSADKFREHILSMSLFPNLHNKPLMMRSLDASM